SLREAASLPTSSFKIGSATVFPEGFSLNDGMGPGGITVVVIEAVGQKTAYVVIDGNNMVSGLREQILSALKSIGFNDCEVFTTDTHAVSAVVFGRRGYHPIGEAIDDMKLIGCIEDTAKRASTNLETCKAGYLKIVVPEVKVIGKARLNSLSLLVDNALRRAKKIVLPIFGCEGLLLILILANL
ncbi:DUF2070 family protein, partial [Candidatus Bathyarchaeota archaeon]|nr:DUF2070 family protein [Candidatus Bathyarchaeota archaeon]